MSIALRSSLKEWKFEGRAIERGCAGEIDCDVTGDPCIVFDDDAACYRMFYFAQRHDAQRNEQNSVAQALSAGKTGIGPGSWNKIGAVEYTNADRLLGGQGHKPWIVMDPGNPNRAVRPDGRYWLLVVSYIDGSKVIQRARAERLAGPWLLDEYPLIVPGGREEFDGYHVDTVTAYWFADREEVLFFYKGYPARPQPQQSGAPWGSSLAAAVMGADDDRPRKLGPLFPPVEEAGHWLSGWVSSVQLVPRTGGGFWGLVSGSPTPPDSIEREPSMREPAPSLGGWLYTEAEFPVSGWKAEASPIIAIDDLPSGAAAAGMGTNLWRHHLLGPVSGRYYLLCNSGRYGEERMFMRSAPADADAGGDDA